MPYDMFFSNKEKDLKNVGNESCMRIYFGRESNDKNELKKNGKIWSSSCDQRFNFACMKKAKFLEEKKAKPVEGTDSARCMTYSSRCTQIRVWETKTYCEKKNWFVFDRKLSQRV